MFESTAFKGKTPNHQAQFTATARPVCVEGEENENEYVCACIILDVVSLLSSLNVLSEAYRYSDVPL